MMDQLGNESAPGYEAQCFSVASDPALAPYRRLRCFDQLVQRGVDSVPNVGSMAGFLIFSRKTMVNHALHNCQSVDVNLNWMVRAALADIVLKRMQRNWKQRAYAPGGPLYLKCAERTLVGKTISYM